MNSPAPMSDDQALSRLLGGLSADALKALIRRGFGSAVLNRLRDVEGLETRIASADELRSWVLPMLENAGLDASMVELFYVAAGVPWDRCRDVSGQAMIPVTPDPPGPTGPAEIEPDIVVLSVAPPPSRGRWTTRSLLCALQGLHRRLEESPALRTPGARAVLAGVTADERHLVLRANRKTCEAISALTIEELSVVTGLTVLSVVGGGPLEVDRSRPLVVVLTGCALLLLLSVFLRQWQLVSVLARGDTAVAPAVARLECPEQAPAEPCTPPLPEVPGSPSTLPTPPPEGAVGATSSAWLVEFQSVLVGTGATVDVESDRVVVAFSDELLAFAPGESTLSERALIPMRKIAHFLETRRNIRVWVEGHTDDSVYSAGNWMLGARRALAVVDALTGAGVSPGRIVLTSHGEHQPVAPNTTAEGRRRNRRVELILAVPAPE